ncbi:MULTISPECIES: LytR/AlgR family response regulator transcription factor [Flavobacterium]|uniref:DNA-binding LytR/AlgR family response regulator n=3 Tax=Flavobacterium TaxID=237 RepID=A0A7W7IY03_9FLAO|nr:MULTISPECIES: LytTR family DNA-binding domain-containing protein [Flavobacterium]MBB4802689.1 DNA-binding LytR/AlgR family response regulator [Flavobacterium nitrogenifigens]MBB6387647.1 DNA-binding LytR/AlgR family response regulator [Flavobacterium notoginsengisoli]SFD47944.1 two component transcriptional regulator, LytTR family [Flavobacterium phragmitis]
MTIVIIEDEVKTAKALGQLILSIRPDVQILSYIQSIDGAVSYLLENDQPDLIFMDIQLADGQCFEIFKNVEVLSPVIFCTAFDDYAIEAFKSNGIDYVLKPFSRESISQALKKAGELKNFFQRNKKAMPDFDYLLTRNGENKGKSSFLVFKNNKYQTVLTENIAFFYIKNETPTIMTLDKNEYPLTQSLDDIHKLLSPIQFFRVNRQYLVNFSAIREAEHYFSRKILVKLSVPTEEKILVGKEKATAFLSWLENR